LKDAERAFEVILQRLDALTAEIKALREEPAPVRKKPIDRSKELLSLKEAARVLGVDRRTTLTNLIADGVLGTVEVPGSRGIRIPRRELERLLESGLPESAPGRPRRANRARRLPSAEEIERSILAIPIK
jgi:excisionase family DNA binding protein